MIELIACLGDFVSRVEKEDAKLTLTLRTQSCKRNREKNENYCTVASSHGEP